MSENVAPDLLTKSELFSFVVADDLSVSIHVDPLPVAVVLVVGVILWFVFRKWSERRISDFEIEGAELGAGDLTLSFKPNDTDRQIAYKIWVELNTRKIGLPIDIEDDVISEVYDSWHDFFGITRELIKDIPVSKVRRDSTGKIIALSIEVLNEGLRPHLTKWQARFRHWYGQKMEKKADASPQDVQKEFPAYDELCADLLNVNNKLIRYREKMNELVKSR